MVIYSPQNACKSDTRTEGTKTNCLRYITSELRFWTKRMCYCLSKWMLSVSMRNGPGNLVDPLCAPFATPFAAADSNFPKACNWLSVGNPSGPLMHAAAQVSGFPPQPQWEILEITAWFRQVTSACADETCLGSAFHGLPRWGWGRCKHKHWDQTWQRTTTSTSPRWVGGNVYIQESVPSRILNFS